MSNAFRVGRVERLPNSVAATLRYLVFMDRLVSAVGTDNNSPLLALGLIKGLAC